MDKWDVDLRLNKERLVLKIISYFHQILPCQANPYIKDSKVEVCSGGGGVDRQSTQERWGGRGEGRGVNQHSTWKGSMKALQGLPLTMLILGG